jgi:hypothetical protein
LTKLLVVFDWRKIAISLIDPGIGRFSMGVNVLLHPQSAKIM